MTGVQQSCKLLLAIASSCRPPRHFFQHGPYWGKPSVSRQIVRRRILIVENDEVVEWMAA